jgi:hypothetical protein
MSSMLTRTHAVLSGAATMFARAAVSTVVVAMGIMSMLGIIAGPSVIPASAFTMEAMFAPAMGVTPTGPGAYAEKDAVVEEPRPIIAIGRASVWRSFVIAPLANRWNADFDFNLRASRRQKSQARKQSC